MKNLTSKFVSAFIFFVFASAVMAGGIFSPSSRGGKIQSKRGIVVTASNKKPKSISGEKSPKLTNDVTSALDIKCAGRANQGNTFNQDVVGKVVQLGKVSEAVYKKDQLLKSDITYGLFKMNAAKAKVYLETENGKIKMFSMVGSYDIMGMNGLVVQSVKGADLISGSSVGFAIDKGLPPILIITPGKDFTLENGGSLRFDFWNGDKYESVSSRLVKDTKGKFKVKLINGASKKEVNYLAVNVRGFSAKSMSIHDYQVSKR